jgi:hypothetical protein
MTKNQKIFIGILSFLPIIFILICITAMIFVMRDLMLHGAPDPTVFAGFAPFFVLMALSSLLSFALLIYYIIHAVNNTNISSNERIVWILVFIFAGVIGFPIYWYMRIWKEKPVIPPTANPDNVIRI